MAWATVRVSAYDNAFVESFFRTLKVELVYRQNFKTREEARITCVREKISQQFKLSLAKILRVLGKAFGLKYKVRPNCSYN